MGRWGARSTTFQNFPVWLLPIPDSKFSILNSQFPIPCRSQ
ncbi:hypothetical protein BJP36_42860 [Moorena producens JHB]|uniref:Uncharacterized protein n=1 Tax=Moorena producens (strain JHB) TaxID=1454205 RepID=A0A9Q9UVS3_MOOP1|nr:hypothetical protein [Moorena producens]WAN69106.1 hypothetical protein BJP36_42860 [Moorena producens JHB]